MQRARDPRRDCITAARKLIARSVLGSAREQNLCSRYRYTKPRERISQATRPPFAPGESEPCSRARARERAPGNAASSNKRARARPRGVRRTQRIDSHSCLIKISRSVRSTRSLARSRARAPSYHCRFNRTHCARSNLASAPAGAIGWPDFSA